MIAANRAFGILAKLQLAKAHVERIHKQQAANQRLAYSQNQLDRLGSLYYANEPGQNAQNSAFGATRYQARRRRLRVEAAVAGTILRAEDAGLTLKAKDRSIRIRLAQQHACIVDQVARGKVIRTIGNNVVVLEDIESVCAR